MTETFTTHDRLSLAYSDEGRGLPVLCLAGLTRTMRDFDYVAPHLGEVRLIRMDYRGRGGSDWADPATYTVPVEAQDALALLDHLGLETAAVLGTSRGGLIAMTLAATAKARLIGVCLNDIGPYVDPAGLELIRGYVGKTPVVKTLEEAAAMRGRFLEAAFQGVPHSRWREEVERFYVETPEGLKLNYDPDLARIFDAAEPEANPAPADFWPVFDCLAGLPLAAIRGANSDLLSPETFAEMQRRRPDMIAAEVPGRGHVPFLDEPEAVAAIRAWIDQCR
ncbi:alpha/beta hydrolase [Psychromarinibacter sp. C21-152]|uniref:Alpha/beta hydrolase n=1 Tax=Psychromarinibacter sediminicola TaxID=3033385 RepID=A0AAE3NWU5_9RHOB|nr:alpha/beta hydrolase [Psychromarinibacter sediminicola]MDF0603134.1 alpha/beta hydrolase [Psychromarinibacter sediminicola]